MFTYAKTNIQLYNQLLSGNYSNEEIIRVRKVYDLAVELFTGMYRPSGSTFIAHLVGTASILASLKLSVHMISSGLLHAVYEHGDFGFAGSKLSGRRRKFLKLRLCKEVEEYLVKYKELKWNSQTIPFIHSRFDTLKPDERDVLLIRVANELEDNLDMAALYCPDKQQRTVYISRYGPEIIEFAVKLGYPELAYEMRDVFNKILSSEVPPELISRSSTNRAYRIPPRSYKKRIYISVMNKLQWTGKVLKKKHGF